MQLQPSEFVKIVLIITLAWLLSKSSRINLNIFGRSLIILGVPAALVIAEPDLGMAILMITIWAGLLVFWGLSWRIIIALGLIGALLFGAGWHWVFLPYQKQRITSFLNPTRDPLGAGYNVTQAIVALGSGQLLGRGLGHGPQSQLKFLPERQTDFILASIGEELGFVGIALIIILYAVMLTRIIRIAHHTNDPFGQLICAGACIVLAMSLAVSAGMNMGLLPVTGIPLSFVSYGGSDLLSSFILLGIVQSVSTHSRFAQSAPIEISHIM
jgi:rod shape determining protein RodA